MKNICGPHLLLGAHELAHCHFNFTNGVEVTVTVSINHDELVVLHLFKVVSACEAVREVWVELILDLLGFPNLNPLSALRLLIQDALRI